MTTRSTPETSITYTDLQPPFDWIREEGRDTLRLFLPGFKKENIRGQLDPTGNLKITGKQPLSKNRWTRFEREFLVPEYCNQDEISAKIDNGILYVVMPKLITPVNPTETSNPKIESYGKYDNDYDARNPKLKSQEKDGIKKKSSSPGNGEKKYDLREKSPTSVHKSDAEMNKEKLTLKGEIDKKDRVPGIGKGDKHVENEDSKRIKEKLNDSLHQKSPSVNVSSSEDREKWKLSKAEVIDTESRKLVLNMAVSALVLVAFGLHVYLKFGSRRRKDGE